MSKTVTHLLLLVVLLVGGKANAQTTNFKSYALLVTGIAKNFHWPSYQDEFEIVVFGNSKVFNELQVMSNQKKIEGADIKVVSTDKITDINTPKIIYLSDGKSSMLDDIIRHAEGKAVMIIAEREGLFKKGAGMSFVVNSSNQLRLDINESDLVKRSIRVPSNMVAMLANEKI